MTTFNTVDELMQALDENPHLMEALRSRILTRELLELPQIVARLAVRVDQLTEQVSQLTEQVSQLTERLDRLTERVDQLTERVDRLTEQVGQLTARLDQLTARVDQLTERVDRLTETVTELARTLAELIKTVADLDTRLTRRLDQIVDDLGRLKNVGTITTARDHAEVIASVLGMRCQKQLRRNEIIDLSSNQDTTGIRPGDLISFRQADLIMEATDDDGELHYIAVEASFTADQRDTRRAIRNAGYLTRFTGRPARAVVAAMRKDWEIQSILDSGQVLWYELEEPDTD